MPWFAKNTGGYVTLGYDSATGLGTVTSTLQADYNIQAAWTAFASKGWSQNAVAAVLGVCAYESGWNPWRWQSDDLIASTDYYNLHTATTHGYGLNQFTPAWSYIGEAYPFAGFAPNYLDQAGRASDGNAQCIYIDHACSQLGYYFRSSLGPPYTDYDTYPYIPFNEFYQTTITDFTNLVCQWLWNYGRGMPETTQSLAMRVAAAEYAFITIGGTLPNIYKNWLWPQFTKHKLLGRRRKLI